MICLLDRGVEKEFRDIRELIDRIVEYSFSESKNVRKRLGVIMEYGDGILKKYIEFLMKAGIPVMIAFVAIMLVGGCSAVELEERCFPMLAGIDKKDGQYEFYYSIENE